MKKSIIVILVLSIFAIACSVGGYSFSGGSVGDAKTINIKDFPNRASNVEPTLSSLFTEGLKDRFVRQSSLSLTNGKADMVIEGEITGYRLSPVGASADETAAKERLTVTVQVRFTNLTDETKDFESSFSRYSEYSKNTSLDAVLNQLLEDIVDQLTEDIYNKALVNW